MFEKLKARLCGEANQWYKMWSSWLAAAWGLIVLVFWNDPTILPQLLTTLPDGARAWLSPVVVAVVTGLPVMVRLMKQHKLAPVVPVAPVAAPGSE